MDGIDLNNSEDKIRELLYSGESANDLLVIEIIKQLNNSKTFYLPLICLVMIIRNESLMSEIFD